MNNKLALGSIETYGLVVAIYVLDVMCKTAQVEFIGYKKTGSGRVTVMIQGEVDAVATAVNSGIETGKSLGHILSHSVIARTDSAVVPLIEKLHKISFSLQKSPVVKLESMNSTNNKMIEKPVNTVVKNPMVKKENPKKNLS